MTTYKSTIDITVNLPGSTTVPGDSARWFYNLPDQFYQDIRTCAPCPAVLVLGEIENHLKSHAVQVTEEIHWFIGDLFSLSLYGKHIWDMMNNGFPTEESNNIGRAVMGVFGPRLAFSNTDNVGPFYDYIRNEPGTPIVIDKIRVTAGNSQQSVVEEGLVKNSKGNWMLPVKHFDPENLPTGYGLEILKDPRVFMATIQKATGALRPFPQLGGADVPIPLFSRWQTYNPAFRLSEYEGPLRSPYYTPPLTLQILNLLRSGSTQAIKQYMKERTLLK